MTPRNAAATEPVLQASEGIESPKNPQERDRLCHFWMVQHALLWPRTRVHG
eukprot:CAMPEP_0172686652 /NCGR_PEP_ID=MMETSP1074-20121228/21092_1 /TAXON_ID=2916 /ORGANISM="Ceratium fusus, Strain PA161109" /LENGTH=50 /DNA_ID=CAMNT_0013505987 /DNA_START=588 /DNA_END=740 /DNA_ORIENTATION=-